MAEEGLAREPHHDVRVLADRPQHAERRDSFEGFAEDVDAVAFELVEMVHVLVRLKSNGGGRRTVVLRIPGGRPW